MKNITRLKQIANRDHILVFLWPRKLQMELNIRVILKILKLINVWKFKEDGVPGGTTSQRSPQNGFKLDFSQKQC